MLHRESNNKNGVLLTIRQAAEETNLGTHTVRRIAEKAGAVRRIGGCVRVNRSILLKFIENNCK
ncbi:MAG: helix-turn-helix domain-containing protein [Lachnospiraceae bacterium]|nr:helix-turn-helix domain-containing protein [Lachnospiraceae bacterium]